MGRFTTHDPPGLGSGSRRSALYTKADEVEFERAMSSQSKLSSKNRRSAFRKLRSSLLLFCTGLILAFAFVFLKQRVSLSGGPGPNPVPPPVQTVAPTLNNAQRGSHIQFGNVARSQCQENCKQKQIEQDFCIRSCRRFSLENFARRVTAGNLNPTKDAGFISDACIRDDIDLGESPSFLEWQEQMTKGLKLLTSIELISAPATRQDLIKWSKDLLEINQSTLLPPGKPPLESEVAELLVRTSCVKLHTVLSSRGEQSAVERDDSFSKRNYKKMKELLTAETTIQEGTLLQRAKKAGVGR